MRILKLKERFFHELGNSYPQEEIESFFYLLVEHHLKRSRLDLALDPSSEITPDDLEGFEKTIERLNQNEPIQYIIGSTEFLGLDFLVNKDVLIPRPETEELVQWIIKDFGIKNTNSNLTILDIGTGSGCIAISLAKNRLDAHVDALDISDKALRLAAINAVENDAEVNFIKKDILQDTTLENHYDIIVSNPPYVTQSDKEIMSANVVDHEPDLALFVPKDDPLIFYKKILNFGQTNLNKKGSLYLEINEYLSDDLLKLEEIQFFSNIELRKDIYGRDRMVKCTKNE